MRTAHGVRVTRALLSEVETLSSFQAEPEQIAAALGIDQEVFNQLLRKNSRLRRSLQRGRSLGTIKIRQSMRRLASKNAEICLMASEIFLGQTEEGPKGVKPKAG